VETFLVPFFLSALYFLSVYCLIIFDKQMWILGTNMKAIYNDFILCCEGENILNLNSKVHL